MQQDADRKCIEGSQVGVIADAVAKLANEGQAEQEDGDRDHGLHAVLTAQPNAKNDQRRRREFRLHRPHGHIDVDTQHQHVGQDIQRLI